MKILLDECVSKRLKKHLEEFEVFTVIELNLSGIKIGIPISRGKDQERKFLSIYT